VPKELPEAAELEAEEENVSGDEEGSTE